MAYWQNGKLYMHCSTQSTVQTVPFDRALGATSIRTRVVVVSEYTGGGFGSKATGTITSIIPALLSKKAERAGDDAHQPRDEHYIGRARPALHGRVKVGFAKDGRITALDMFVVSENGPYEQVGDTGQSGRHRVAPVPAASDAVARRVGADQHAAAPRAEPAGRHAGHHADGADSGEGGAQARRRSGRDSPHQRAGGQGAVRSGESRAVSAPTRPARSSRRRSTRAPSMFNWDERKAQQRQAAGLEGPRRRRGDEHASSPGRPASTACSSSSPTAGCTSSRASATSAPSR